MSLTATPDGVLLVDKAPGMTSHDVVAIVRRRLQMKKVGHCGTLDPIATGLLLLTLGRGTKIQDLLMSEDKEYSGTMILGINTDTQDSAGIVTEERPVPPLDEAAIRAAFDKYAGDFYQMPPMVSAKKHGGVPLYKLSEDRIRATCASRSRRAPRRECRSPSRCPKSISPSFAAKAFMSGPMPTTSARLSVAAPISRICGERSRAGFRSTARSRWTS